MTIKRLEDFSGWTGLALAAIKESMDKINALAGGGREVVELRTAEYRYWDAEVIRVDRVAEDTIIARLKSAGVEAVILSEEAQRVELVKGKVVPDELAEKVYFILDPFDGSGLYRRQIPAFWYTCLGVYGLDGQPRCAVVGDVINKAVDFVDTTGVYSAELRDEQLVNLREIRPSKIEDIRDAYVETYLMKPSFMYPIAPRYQPLLEQFKFILPNGGPCGFADVAKGKVDVYIAFQEPHVEVFTGLPIAEKAGVVVTTFDGRPVEFEDDINRRYQIVCSATETLHKQVLRELGKIAKG